jgi:thioredoxin-related protein
MRTLFLCFALLLSLAHTSAQNAMPNADGSYVKWMSIEEAVERSKELPRPLLIDVYTDWCGWCKHMMKTTYANQALAAYINANFYPVKFNAETKDTIVYLDSTYVNTNTGPRATHQLAIKLLGPRQSYPTTLFVNNNFQFNLVVPGYLDVQKIEPLLLFTLENVYLTTSYDDFNALYQKAFFDSLRPAQGPVEWLSLNQALEKNKKDPRKIYIQVVTNFCNSCKVMVLATFSDTAVAAYLNKHYHAVLLYADGNDTIYYQGQAFINDPTDNNPFHPFALAAMNNRLILPAALIMDEKSQIINMAPYFMSPRGIWPIIQFFGSDAYKKQSWDEYRKEYEKLLKEKQ